MFSEDTSPLHIARTLGVPESIIELVCPSIPVALNKDNKEIHYPFKLPITYVDKSRVHLISNTLKNDLELDTTIYEKLFEPKNEFSENLMKEWGKQMTTDIPF